ncbi:MAG TPA: outer membrane beta-barrel protein, partial [Chitinophagaceae bacterium]
LKSGGGDINISFNPSDPIAGLLGGNNTGINTTFGGGVNYNNIIGTKTDFQSNYFYNRYNPTTQSTIQRQYFSPANLYKQNSYTDNLNNNHRLNFNVDYQLDSFTSVKISPSLSYQKTNNKSSSSYSTSSLQDTRINDGSSDNLVNNEGYNLNTNILFRKKFHKRGRTFSINMFTSLNENNGSGSLRSLTNFYDQAGAFLSRDSISQINNNESALHGYNARAVYTEPIFKRSLLEFSLGKSNTVNTSSRHTYDYDQNSGKFDQLNSLLTNDFNNSYGYNTAGIRFRKQTKKYNYTAGLSWQQSELEGTIVNSGKDSVIRKSFTNMLPTARFQYYFSKFKNILINYSTNTNQPSVTQLQPLPDNSNPLYIRLGNPELKQEFTHTLDLHASFLNPFKNRNFFIFLNTQETQNKIVNYDKINSLGIDSVKPVNVNGVYNLNANVSYGFPVHFLKGSLDISSDISYAKGKQLLDDSSSKMETNKINTVTMGPNLRLDMSPIEKINFSLSAGVSYSKSHYSVQGTRSSEYLNQEYSADISWEMPKGFYFATDLNYIINGQHAEGFNAKVPLWNASVSKQMLRFNRGELK